MRKSGQKKGQLNSKRDVGRGGNALRDKVGNRFISPEIPLNFME
jgi:hypothetical protein